MIGQTLLLIIQVIAAIGLIALVLIQQGKGAEAGASFGSGASQTVFGSTGSGNFLTRTTAIFATIFFLSSLGLAYFSKHTARDEVLFSSKPAATQKVEKAPVGDLPSVPAMNTSKNELPVVPQPEKK